jgi:DNA processing protein
MPNIEILSLDHKDYPELLKKIYDPPKELFINGDVSALSSRCIAIVGTRKATSYGKEIARKLGRELAQTGFTVVSGLAEGIDTEAHAGALDGGGKTIAVFGCGIDQVFPAQNAKLAGKISNNGALVSEYKPGTFAAKWTFPRRNRIIAGLSVGVVMVEGHYDSGAMITAKLALDEGREVFAVPGNVELDQSKGPHWLIKQGARLVEGVDDILEEYGIKRDASVSSVKLDSSKLTKEEMNILNNVSKELKHIDDIARNAGVMSFEALSLLSILEVKGFVKQLPGKYFVTC